MKEKLTRELKAVFDSTKGLVSSNLVSAVASGKIKNVDRNALEPLLSLINATIDQSFFNVYESFIKTAHDVCKQESELTLAEKPAKKK